MEQCICFVIGWISPLKTSTKRNSTILPQTWKCLKMEQDAPFVRVEFLPQDDANDTALFQSKREENTSEGTPFNLKKCPMGISY